MISYHPRAVELDHPERYPNGFKTVDTNDATRIAKGIGRYVWSPIVFRGGRRLSENFLFADWLALDFDDPGMTLAEAVRTFCDMQHVIGTTRSHRREKKGVVCDRYRVVLRLTARVTSFEAYVHTTSRLIARYSADESAKDPARFFWPCQEIVSVADDGYTEDVAEPPPRRAISYPPRGIVPGWTREQLALVVLVGERSSTFYRVAKDLLRAGLSPEAALGAIVASPTYRGVVDPRSYKKLVEAVRSAQRSLLKEAAPHGRTNPPAAVDTTPTRQHHRSS